MKGMSIMKNYKKLAVIMSVMMFGSVTAACGDSNNENKTPHTTYSANDIENMSDDELKKALENAANEIEMSEKATNEAPAEEEGIDIWKDVKVTFDGVNGYAFANIEYVGNNQAIKDNVQFYVDSHYKNKDLDKPLCEANLAFAYSGSTYWITASYDESVLKEQGITLIKNIDINNAANKHYFDWSDYYTEDGVTDLYDYPVPELRTLTAVTDETDVSIYNDAIDAILERARKKTDWREDQMWIMNENIQPIWGSIQKEPEGDGSTLEIAYADENGNYIGTCCTKPINVFDNNGEWYRRLWETIPDVFIDVNKGISYDSFEEYQQFKDMYVYFEIE